MFKKVDCLRIHVTDLGKALIFYQEKLGLELVWKNGKEEAGLKMGNSDSEIVLVREELEQPEVDITVDSVDKSIKLFEDAGVKFWSLLLKLPLVNVQR